MVILYQVITQKTQVDGFINPLQTDTTKLKCVIYRSNNWTSGVIIKYPQNRGLGFNNYLDEVTALFDVDDISFFQTS